MRTVRIDSASETAISGMAETPPGQRLLSRRRPQEFRGDAGTTCAFCRF
jgi:hypothetical protein